MLLIPRSQSSSWFWGPQADLWGPVIHVPTRQQRAMLCAQQLPGIERCSDKGRDWGTFGSLQYLWWVLDELPRLGTAARKTQQ